MFTYDILILPCSQDYPIPNGSNSNPWTWDDNFRWEAAQIIFLYRLCLYNKKSTIYTRRFVLNAMKLDAFTSVISAAELIPALCIQRISYEAAFEWWGRHPWSIGSCSRDKTSWIILSYHGCPLHERCSCYVDYCCFIPIYVGV